MSIGSITLSALRVVEMVKSLPSTTMLYFESAAYIGAPATDLISLTNGTNAVQQTVGISLT